MKEVHNDEVFSILTGKISSAINRTFLRTFATEGISGSLSMALGSLWTDINTPDNNVTVNMETGTVE